MVVYGILFGGMHPATSRDQDTVHEMINRHNVLKPVWCKINPHH